MTKIRNQSYLELPYKNASSSNILSDAALEINTVANDMTFYNRHLFYCFEIKKSSKCYEYGS